MRNEHNYSAMLTQSLIHTLC